MLGPFVKKATLADVNWHSLATMFGENLNKVFRLRIDCSANFEYHTGNSSDAQQTSCLDTGYCVSPVSVSHIYLKGIGTYYMTIYKLEGS